MKIGPSGKRVIPEHLRHLAKPVCPDDEMAARLDQLNAREQRALKAEERAQAAERSAEASFEALREALEGSRTDERSRALEMENERQRQTILTLQKEVTRYRDESTEKLGWDKARYFERLGRDLIDWGREIQQMGETLEDSECAAARRMALNLQECGLSLGEFGENAQAYADDARERQRQAET